ncbi:MAG: ABC transporter ATP-binding protein/permease [Oscillospiraceae bacterium]|nr:ABC transporter ATP-binding protein/permease [Oscillospiraceae bacterium]
MKRILQILKPYRGAILITIIFLFLSTMCNLMLPNLMADIVNEGLVSGQTGFILQVGGYMLLLSILDMGFSIASNFFSSKAAMGFGRDLRSIIFKKITGYSLNEVDKIGAASLITRNTNDTNQIQMLIMIGLRMMVSIPLNMVGGIIMAVSKDPRLSLIIVAVMPVLALVIVINIKWTTPLFKKMQTGLDKLNMVVREGLSGMRVIRAFNRTEHEKIRFENANRDLTQTSLTAMRRMTLMMPLTMTCMNIATIAILVFGAFRVDSGSMLPGDLMAFIQYVTMVLMTLMMATFMLNMIPRAVVSFKRISEVLEIDPEVKDPQSPTLPDPGKRGYVKFDNVTFTYPGAEEPILTEISFEARPGETVAIIGSTGSGKSTLINLIPRFYDIQKGRILIDDVDIRDMEQLALREKIGFIPQKALLFTGTITENILYGKPDATDEEIYRAADIAQASGFINEMESGYDSLLSQDATNVSGGQKQRISIARAVIRNPEIYIFDDSFSALDFKTDANLRKALKPVTKNSTVIIVAQRVSTVMNADRIIVLDEGRMVGLGTHSQLMNSCSVYNEIVSSQLSEEELA